MLSKKQREYILDLNSFSKPYSRQLRYSISKKLSITIEEINLIIEHGQRLGIRMDSLRNLKTYSIPEPKKQVEQTKKIDEDDGW